MQWLKSRQWLVVAVVMMSGLVATACATYYRVTDPQSGRVYYTEKVDRERGGAASFTDAGSGSTITIQNSEVKEITKDEYNVGRFGGGTKPAPAAAPAPAPAAPAPAAPAPAPTPTPESAPDSGGGY
ncbi:MAG TPA: hypothetical protein VML36_00085 [Nitrospiria bacterium]|nr:hypothetical protein [Nitrospiria bacterium]